MAADAAVKDAGGAESQAESECGQETHTQGFNGGCETSRTNETGTSINVMPHSPDAPLSQVQPIPCLSTKH